MQDRKAATGQAAGRPSALMTVQLTNPESPEPQLQLLAGALPPLPHVCRHQPGAACLCQGSVLAALDWLLASPPDDATLEARQRGSDSAHRECSAARQLAKVSRSTTIVYMQNHCCAHMQHA